MTEGITRRWGTKHPGNTEIHSMLVHGWASIIDRGPAMTQNWINAAPIFTRFMCKSPLHNFALQRTDLICGRFLRNDPDEADLFPLLSIFHRWVICTRLHLALHGKWESMLEPPLALILLSFSFNLGWDLLQQFSSQIERNKISDLITDLSIYQTKASRISSFNGFSSENMARGGWIQH